MALFQGFIQNEGDAWSYTLDELGRYFETTFSKYADKADVPVPTKGLMDLIEDELPALACELIGPYLESARLLGQRTAEMHMALSSATDDARFFFERFSQFSQRGLYQSLRGHTNKIFNLLRKNQRTLPEALEGEVHEILAHEKILVQYYEMIRDRKIAGGQIRCHGDFHLGQVLYTGKDFVIIDFEGEPARSFSERKLKRSPMKDVAGMLRSFHYASYAALLDQASRGTISPEAMAIQEKWSQFWYMWSSATFLKAYFEHCVQAPFLPKVKEETELLLNVFLFEKAIYELGYELDNRPDWVKIPIRGMLQLLATIR